LNKERKSDSLLIKKFSQEISYHATEGSVTSIDVNCKCDKLEFACHSVVFPIFFKVCPTKASYVYYSLSWTQTQIARVEGNCAYY